jgi:hypothetical protein
LPWVSHSTASIYWPRNGKAIFSSRIFFTPKITTTASDKALKRALSKGIFNVKTYHICNIKLLILIDSVLNKVLSESINQKKNTNRYLIRIMYNLLK